MKIDEKLLQKIIHFHESKKLKFILNIDEKSFPLSNVKITNSSLPNYYEILGIPKDATQENIKVRFRSLAKEWHPDKNKGKMADKKMIEINKAYEVLSDDKRRKSYDKFLNVS